MNTLRRTSILLVLFAVTLVCAVAADLREALQSFKSSAGLDSAHTSLLVIDLKSGDRILEHNASLPLIPASITKCVTTATLLEKVGSKFRFETPVYYTGHLADGVIEGDLVVEASGDPSLNTVHEPGSSDIVAEIVEALRSLRVHKIQGSILIDENSFPGPSVNPTWQKGDLPHAYGTGTHGFNFEDNASGRRSVSDPASVFKSRLLSLIHI